MLEAGTNSQLDKYILILFEQYVMQDQTHSLFNSKTIERLCSDILISKRQRDGANEWLHLLKAGSLYMETKNYFRFGLIVLQDILGYDVRQLVTGIHFCVF